MQIPNRGGTCNSDGRSSIPDTNYRINDYGQPVMWSSDSLPIPVVISPNFDTFERQNILSAINYWNRVAGGNLLEPMEGIDNRSRHIAGMITITEQFIPIYCNIQPLGIANTAHNRELVTMQMMSIRDSRIEIHNTHEHDGTYLRTIVHELGHALGLNHDAEEESVMYPVVLSTPWSIQREDIEFVRIMLRHN